jgi:hypothetical protein
MTTATNIPFERQKAAGSSRLRRLAPQMDVERFFAWINRKQAPSKRHRLGIVCKSGCTLIDLDLVTTTARADDGGLQVDDGSEHA